MRGDFARRAAEAASCIIRRGEEEAAAAAAAAAADATSANESEASENHYPFFEEHGEREQRRLRLFIVYAVSAEVARGADSPAAELAPAEEAVGERAEWRLLVTSGRRRRVGNLHRTHATTSTA